MDGRHSPQSPSISQLTSPPETIPSCYGDRATPNSSHSPGTTSVGGVAVEDFTATLWHEALRLGYPERHAPRVLGSFNVCLRFATARALFDAFPEVSGKVAAKPIDQSPVDFLKALASANKLPDAITFCTYLLPRREAVWWACGCVRRLSGEIAPDRAAGLLAAEAWVYEPDDEHRQAALDVGKKGESSNPDDLARARGRLVRRISALGPDQAGSSAAIYDRARRAYCGSDQRAKACRADAPGPSAGLHCGRHKAGRSRVMIAEFGSSALCHGCS